MATYTFQFLHTSITLNSKSKFKIIIGYIYLYLEAPAYNVLNMNYACSVNVKSTSGVVTSGSSVQCTGV